MTSPQISIAELVNQKIRWAVLKGMTEGMVFMKTKHKDTKHAGEELNRVVDQIIEETYQYISKTEQFIQKENL
jgi:hypothetical protein